MSTGECPIPMQFIPQCRRCASWSQPVIMQSDKLQPLTCDLNTCPAAAAISSLRQRHAMQFIVRDL